MEDGSGSSKKFGAVKIKDKVSVIDKAALASNKGCPMLIIVLESSSAFLNSKWMLLDLFFYNYCFAADDTFVLS